MARRWLSHLRLGPAAGLGLVVMAFITVVVVEMSLRPIYEAPDEISHLHYAQSIAAHAALPGAGIHERQQPPLYYLLAAAPLKMGLGLTGVRLLSLVCALITLALCAMVAREIWPGRPWLWVAATAIAAALPEMQYLAGAATNESLAWTVGALLVLLCIRVVRSRAPTPGLVLCCGVVVGIAAITREEDWILAAVLVGTMCWRWRGRLLSRSTAAAAGLTLLIAGWWFVRNLLSFGSVLPPETPLAAVGPHTLQNLEQLRLFFSQMIAGLSGTYGDGQHDIHAGLGGTTLPFDVVSLVVVVAVVLGSVAVTARGWRGWTSRTRAMAVVLGLAPALLFCAALLNSIVVDLQPQTRYLFSALPALCVAAVAVGRHVTRTLRRRAVVVGLLGTAAAVGLVFDIAGIATAASLPAFQGQAVPDNPQLTGDRPSGPAGR